MPYNIFGEQWADNCPCPGCRRVRGNRDYTDGQAYYSRREAMDAADVWRIRRGEPPHPRYPPGLIAHTTPAARPEAITFTVSNDGPYWTEVRARGAWDEGAIREYIAMMDARQRGEEWGIYRAEPEMTPQQRLLSRYPRSDPRKNYSWRPAEWTMLGDGPSFYGMEIEIQCRDHRIMHHAQHVVGKSGHLKNDSSIGGGFELVTQPMSYPWAMENFPWALLPELAEMGCQINAAVNGIHVHVNRDGFTSSAHMLRWLKFIYRNRSQVTRIARRETTRYGSFTEEIRQAHYKHILAEKARARLSATEAAFSREASYDNELAYAQANRDYRDAISGDGTKTNRYQAINTRGLDTLEMRMFASTLSVLEAQAALQMAAASVEYTRGIRAAQVCKGAWGWVSFSAWLRDSKETYPALYQANRFARMPAAPTAIYVMSATPRRGL
jgi:Putative amidoligase enzyme